MKIKLNGNEMNVDYEFEKKVKIDKKFLIKKFK
jgi:hypothetical protein